MQEANLVTITIYKWAGEKLFFKIKSECEECDVSIGLIKQMIEKDFEGNNIKLEIKPWLDYVFEALRKRSWHAPIILINGKLFSQGKVPDIHKLKKAIELEIQKA